MTLTRVLVVLMIALLVAPVGMASGGGRGQGGGRAGGKAGGHPARFSRSGHGHLRPFPPPARPFNHGLRRQSVFSPRYVQPFKSERRPHGKFGVGSSFVPFVGFGGSTVAVATVVGSGYDPGFAVAPPVSPPVPSLIEYPHGWYQLRGDGVTAPYVWVWVPKPPPPAAVPGVPPAPPPATPAPSPPGSSREPLPAGPRLGEAYSWTDEEGVTTWTNQREKVPQRYRGQALLPGDDLQVR